MATELSALQPGEASNMRRNAFLWLATVVWLDQPGPAAAGMPTILLTDIARMRLQTISFFLFCLLLCTLAVRAIWNALRGDFPRLPRLSFGKALGVVTLWGLLFLIVLTMISGARELMTPGAWKKDGLTYKLAADQTSRTAADEATALNALRRKRLEALRDALWRYAEEHEDHFPSQDATGAIVDELWRVPDPSGMRYLYIGGLSRGRDSQPLAYEPNIFGTEVNVLMTNGRMETMSEPELLRALAADARGR